MTIGGLHGKVYSVDGDTVQLELDRGLKVKIEKSAISLDFSKKSQHQQNKLSFAGNQKILRKDFFQKTLKP